MLNSSHSLKAEIQTSGLNLCLLDGSLGEMHGMKIARLFNFALEAGIPVIGLCDSGGARITVDRFSMRLEKLEIRAHKL